MLEDIPFELGDGSPAGVRHGVVASDAQPPSAAGPADPPAGMNPKIRHIGAGTRPEASEPAGTKIRSFEQKLGAGRHEDSWQRTPNITGTGAIHVKSFHCKLTGDSLDFLDQQINEWLDAHPQYEVKMVTTSIGEWTGKLREPNLIVNVWV